VYDYYDYCKNKKRKFDKVGYNQFRKRGGTRVYGMYDLTKRARKVAPCFGEPRYDHEWDEKNQWFVEIRCGTYLWNGDYTPKILDKVDEQKLTKIYRKVTSQLRREKTHLNHQMIKSRLYENDIAKEYYEPS